MGEYRVILLTLRDRQHTIIDLLPDAVPEQLAINYGGDVLMFEVCPSREEAEAIVKGRATGKAAAAEACG